MITKLACKYLDKHDKGYVSFGDIFRPIIYIVTLFILFAFFINGCNIVMDNRIDETNDLNAISVMIFATVGIILIILVIMLICLAICELWEKYENMTIFECKRKD